MTRKRSIFHILIGCFFLTLYVSCDSTSEVDSSPESRQFARIIVYTQPQVDGSPDSYWLSGQIIADSIPELRNLRVAGKEVRDLTWINNQRGSQFWANQVDVKPELKVELVTTRGRLAGTVESPDSISDLMVTWPENQTLSVAWKGQARYYAVSYHLQCVSGPNEFYVSKVTSAERIQMEVGGQCDVISDRIVSVMGMNGPDPEVNDTGNLEGDGAGFLYWMTALVETRDPAFSATGKIHVLPSEQLKKERLSRLVRRLVESEVVPIDIR